MRRIIWPILMLMLLFPAVPHAEQKPDDRDALAGLKNVKVVFDVRAPDLEALVFNLELFDETWEGMVAQGIQPEMVVAFRGKGVKYLTGSGMNKEALDLVKALKKKGVRFEVCAVAMRVYKVDPRTLVPELKMVRNVLTSLIGYQNKGYASIAIN